MAPQHILSGGPPLGPLKRSAAESTVQASQLPTASFQARFAFYFMLMFSSPEDYWFREGLGHCATLGRSLAAQRGQGCVTPGGGSYCTALLIVQARRGPCPLLWRAVARVWSVLKEGSPAL